MASSISSSFFDPTSPFVSFSTSASSGVLLGLLRVVAQSYRATPAEAVRAYFDGTRVAEKIVGFKQLLNRYFQTCCDEYMLIHQQVTDGKVQVSNLNENHMNEYVYCTLEKIMSQNDGYKHLNCVFDGAMIFCVLQFKYVFTTWTRDGFNMSGSSSSRDGNFSGAEANILRHVIREYLNAANKNFLELRANDDYYRNYRLSCNENNTCQLNIHDEKQRLEQIQQQIEQEAHAYA